MEPNRKLTVTVNLVLSSDSESGIIIIKKNVCIFNLKKSFVIFNITTVMIKVGIIMHFAVCIVSKSTRYSFYNIPTLNFLSILNNLRLFFVFKDF